MQAQITASNDWTPASSSLAQARSGATAALLSDGRVLIIGGNDNSGALAECEFFNTDGSFSVAAAMNVARSGHTAVTLQDGRVLVAGGSDGNGNPTSTAEIFDPRVNPAQGNPWTLTGQMAQARSGHTATLLKDGTVLVAGGVSGSQALDSVEIFNAAAGTNGAFALIQATLSSPRELHATALLQDGRVLIVGGWDGTTLAPQPPATTGAPNALATSDIYNPSTGLVSAGPELNAARMSHTATTQLDGKVFVAGGNNGSADLSSVEVFDSTVKPQPATFTMASVALTTPRSNHSAFLLPHNGGTLIVGGTSGGTALSTTELYMPVYLSQTQTATLNPTPKAMTTPRAYSTGSSLSNGTPQSANDGLLLVAGGNDASGNALSSAELYGFAWVETDKTDYSPGQTVTITGGEWQPGETVTLHFQEVPYFDQPADLTVHADSNGTIFNNQFAPDSHDIGTRLYLTASGSVSQAQAVFADGTGGITPRISVTWTAGSSSPSTVNQSVSFTATVTGTSGNGAPTGGAVEFFGDGIAISDCGGTTGITVTAGVALTSTAVCATSVLPASATGHAITTQYLGAGDAVYDNSLVSSAVTQVVGPLTPTVGLTASPASPSAFGTNVTFTAFLTGVSLTPVVPAGTMAFADNGTTIATCSTVTVTSAGVATCAVSNMPAGNHTITATYSGDPSFVAFAPGSANYTVVGTVPTVTFTGAPTSAAYSSTFNVTAATNASVLPTISGTIGVCSVGTVSGTPSDATATVTMTSGSGTCNLTANWAADSNYLAASAAQSTTATKIAPTVTFTGAPATAGYHSTFSVATTTNASTTALITASGACSIAGNAVTITGGSGTCNLTANWAADSNYLAATATQSTNATLLMPTVTFTGAPATAGYRSTFNVATTTNASTTAVITASGACSIAGNTVTMTSGTGTCNLTANWAADTNYAAASLSHATNATKVVLTVTAPNVTKILDAPNPAINNVTYSGFVSGDNASSLGGTLTCTTTAITTSPVGSYPITCSGLTSSNYAISYNSGTLKILYASPGGTCDGDLSHTILQPINADGTSVWKQGRTIPVKFRVCDVNGVSIGTAGVVTSFNLTGIIGGTVTNVDEIVDSTTPDSAFRWDPTGQQWIFNLSTANLPAGQTYVYTITLNDGSTIMFQYGLR